MADIAIHTERFDFEKVGEGSRSYVPKARFKALVFRSDESIAVTIEVNRGFEKHEVTIWVGPESYDDLLATLADARALLKAETVKVKVNNA